MKNYILNKTTRKIELHFSKKEYMELSQELKKQLKKAYLFKKTEDCWVSRSTNNHYWAIKVAEKLGFEKGEDIGKRLTYEEEEAIKRERAEHRQERYEGYADNANKRGTELQKSLDAHRGDIAFFTQPIIRGHKGSESFKNYRDKLFNRYGKGFEEYKKSEYFRDKAKTLQRTVDGSKFKDRLYLSNRIKECTKNIKIYEKNIASCEQHNKMENLEHWLDKFEYEVDKLAFMQNALDEIGGVKCTPSNVKVGYEVKTRFGWETVTKVNPKTVESQPLTESIKMFISKREYSEIFDVRIPEGFKEEKKETKNPFSEGDVFVQYACGDKRIIRAYEAVKTTAKTVTIKEIAILDNKPVKGEFKDFDGRRRQIKEDKFNKGNIYISDDNYRLYKYVV